MISGPGIPAESVGKARVFRARFRAEDAAVGQTIQHIMEPPLRTRRRRSATFRPETLIETAPSGNSGFLPLRWSAAHHCSAHERQQRSVHRWTVADGKMFS